MKTLIKKIKPAEAYVIFKEYYADNYVAKLDEAMMLYVDYCNENKLFSAKEVDHAINEKPTEDYIEILNIVHFIRHDYLIDEILQRENKMLFIIKIEVKKAIEQSYAVRLIDDEALKDSLYKAKSEWENREQNCLNRIATIRALKDLINKFQR